MITTKAGNILEADVQAVVNTVNTVGVMGKGIALQFRKAYPEMYAGYARACERGDVVVGRMHVYDRGDLFNPRYIVNFPTKKHWKGKSKLRDIEAGLADLVRWVRETGVESLAVPPLGCGHGGLDWADVRPLIVAAFDATPGVSVHLYEPAGAPAPAAVINRTSRPKMTAARGGVIRILAKYGELGYDLTMIEVQKLLYFFQEAGERLKLHFTAGAYGPYADEVRHILDRFEGHFTLGYGDGKNAPTTPIELLADALEEAELFTGGQLAGDEGTTARLGRVTELIEGFESPYGMELLSSVHWVATRSPQTVFDADTAVEAVRAWSPRKAQLMRAEHIRLAWDRLMLMGWLPHVPAHS